MGSPLASVSSSSGGRGLLVSPMSFSIKVSNGSIHLRYLLDLHIGLCARVFVVIEV